jgi:hypothetical protein
VLTVTREERQQVDRGQYLAPLLGLMMIMIDGYDLQSIGYVAPEIARAWSLDIAAFGVVFAAGLGGTIPGAMLAGPGFGQRALILCGGGCGEHGGAVPHRSRESSRQLHRRAGRPVNARTVVV